MPSVSLHWFINDLRLPDNPALCRAAMADRLICLYVIDPRWFRPGRQQLPSMGEKRRTFLLQSLADLDRRLRTLGQQLLVLEGHPESLIPELVRRYRVNRLTVNEVCTVNEYRTLASIDNACHSLVVDTFAGNQLLSSRYRGHREFPLGFSQFRKQVEPLECRPIMAAPPSLPATPLPPTQPVSLVSPGSGAFAGGETFAQVQLGKVFDGMLPRHYKSNRDALDQWDGSTKLSPWLALGCISPVQVWWRLLHWQDTHGFCESSYWVGFELLWREFFHHLAREQGTTLFRFGGLHNKRPLTSFYPSRFKAWCEGSTPEPLVNAIMKQLRCSGFISNRARQIAASYLVNELAVDWRYGAAWFEYQLIDYDAAVNWGNWQYIAGVGVDPRGGRRFNMDLQRARFDPDGEYVARWSGRVGIAGERPAEAIAHDYVGWP